MSEQTILICDGCELPSTNRKPVHLYRLEKVGQDEGSYEIVGDAHDWNCFGRIISRKRKAIREAAKAEKAEGSKPTKK